MRKQRDFHITGPDYPRELGAAVQKFRRRGVICTAYGEAVLAAIRTKQRQELQRELPSHVCYCASMTSHNTGEAILQAIANRQRNASIAYADKARRKRPAHVWEQMYKRAMEDKHD